MVNILFYDDNDILSGNNVAKTIYDPACGTGGMLSVAEEYLHSLNASTELVSFGQEINDQTFAICKADMLIKGNNADYIKDGNTLSDDQFAGSTFDYILSNPPFGREWKNEKAKVEEEAKLGFGGRLIKVEAELQSFIMVPHFLQEMQEADLLKSEDIFLKMICLRQSLLYRMIFSITQELQPISGYCQIKRQVQSEKEKCS